jgi:hypothetical protein
MNVVVNNCIQAVNQNFSVKVNLTVDKIIEQC